MWRDSRTVSPPSILSVRMRHLLAFALSLLVATSAFAQNDDDDYDPYNNAQTIRKSDVPKNAPRFEQYPALEAFGGKIAAPDIHASPDVKMFRTRIREAAKSGPNFAGHYTIGIWGCGAGCVMLVFIDENRGKVFFADALTTVQNDNVAEELEDKDGRLIQFRRSSRLLIVYGGVNEDPKRRGISYFEMKDGALKRIRFVAK